MTIQMKATEQYFPVVLFIMLYKVVLTFDFVDEILSVTIQMKATEQSFPVRSSSNFKVRGWTPKYSHSSNDCFSKFLKATLGNCGDNHMQCLLLLTNFGKPVILPPGISLYQGKDHRTRCWLHTIRNSNVPGNRCALCQAPLQQHSLCF